MRAWRAGWISVAVLTLAVGAAVTWAKETRQEAGDQARPTEFGAKEASASTTRLREGATLRDEPGAFQFVGDRLVFVFERTRRQATVLENLAAERVAREVRDSPARPSWAISAVVTEYQGANFLLLERAIRRRAEAPSERSPQ